MMASRVSFCLVLIAIIHCGKVFPTSNAEKAFVRPNTSVPCPNSSQLCLTFNEYAQKVNQYFVDNTTFLFLPGTHELDVQLDLENLSNISFLPSDELNTHNDTVQILISPSIDITWTNCDNVEISGLICILSGHFNFPSNKDVPSVIIQKTTGFSLTNLTLIGNGTRQFILCISSHIQISNLVVTSTKAPILSASNSAIDFYGQSIFSDNNINTTNIGYILSFENCSCNVSGNISIFNNTGVAITANGGENSISGYLSFVNNTFSSGFGALNFVDSTSIISGSVSFVNNTSTEGGSLIQLYGATCDIPGNVSFVQNDIYGGVAVYITDNSTFFISGIASFIRNRGITSINGGAMYATHGSRITFEESSNITFTDNSATISGGAIFMEDSNLTMYGRVLFERNSAGYYGGAITIFEEESRQNNMINCSGISIILRNNSGRYGGAIYASNGANIELRDILFERNTAVNDGGAVYVIDSSVNMAGTVRLVQNSALRGGAMAFIETPKLLLAEPLIANFSENSATMSGGAIFFDDDTSGCQLCTTTARLVNSPSCFIELSSRFNIRLNFDSNNADFAGRIFYGGNLDICSLHVGSEIFYGHALSMIASISNVNIDANDYEKNTTSNISSDPLQVCICKNDSLVCNSNIQIETVRGRQFTLQAVIVGQGKGTIPSAVRISLNNGVQISAVQRTQNTGKTCTNISYSLFAESNTTEVTLFPDDGPCRDAGIGPTQIDITFLPCPNGFIQNGSECVCEERLKDFKALCNISDGSIKWTSNRFWMGALYINDSNQFTYEGLILHHGCPFDYCVDTPVPITLDNLDIQCNHNHSGILCGSCKENYSIAFGNLHCLLCSNNYLALILPFGLAGIALVAIVLLLRMTVTIGTINGLIFYANVIQVNRSIFFPAGATNILTVFIAWLNLDLGIETCFYDGMTTYAYTWLQFLFPFYIWFLIGLIIVVSRYSRRFVRIFGNNPVASLSTLLLISYSKILRTIIIAVSIAELEYSDGNNKAVWLYDGSVAYAGTGSDNHLALVIFATLILVLLFIPYTLLLFCAHWLKALSHWRILSWLNKIKPFMDTYHAPYKKQTRYWTGLLLFVRLLIFGFDAIKSELILIVLTSITAVLLALAWLHKGIYESSFTDFLEAFFIVNLCIFSATTYQTANTYEGVSQAGLAYFFVGIAFAAFTCVVLFHAYMLLQKTAVWKKIPKFNVKKYRILYEKEEDDDFLPDGHKQSTTTSGPGVTQTSVGLREPLFDP